MNCCQRESYDQLFDDRTARRDLRRYRRRGPLRTTRLLIEGLLAQGIAGATLLDIGGGVGAIHHELLDAGARRGVHVDLSAAYLGAAREEADRRGHESRMRFVQADFVELSEGLDRADIVTLDRVICCYPDMPRLVARSSEKALKLYGAVFPRGTWWTRIGVAFSNALMRIRGSPFRAFVHPPAEIDSLLRSHGFARRYERRTLVWQVAVYARTAA